MGSRRTLTEQKIQRNPRRISPCAAGVRLTPRMPTEWDSKPRTLELIKSSEPRPEFDGSDHVSGNKHRPRGWTITDVNGGLGGGGGSQQNHKSPLTATLTSLSTGLGWTSHGPSSPSKSPDTITSLGQSFSSFLLGSFPENSGPAVGE